ncbi:MAG: hypothetical protein QXX41_05815 [Nitrososphaerota archaeon]
MSETKIRDDEITCRVCGYSYTINEAIILIIHGRTILRCPNCGLLNIRRG